MARITGMDYRNKLLYAVLSASNVFHLLRIAYSSPREKLVREICSLGNRKIDFLHWTLVDGDEGVCACVWGGGGTGSVSLLKDRKTLSAGYIWYCG